MLLAEVYERVGLIPHILPPHYPPDWFKHRSAELYLAGLLEHGREVESPQPGDAAIFRLKGARCYAHGAIVTNWPMMINAHWSNGVERSDGRNGVFRDRPVKFFDPF
jgi:cell wall-associated NlpC family hydrolase